MINISEQFTNFYLPYKALLIYQSYQSGQATSDIYVESYDVTREGKPINAHPLSLKETIDFSALLQTCAGLQNDFLKPKGLLPENVLYIDNSGAGCAIWFTPPQKRAVLFSEKLGIPSGTAYVPGMIWMAGRESLSVFAVLGSAKPTLDTALFHAPFFNTNANGAVCMGNVEIDIDHHTNLEAFITQWENYFFGSYFSHMLQDGGKTSQNIVQLWQQQVSTGYKFPEKVLVPNGNQLQSLIK